MNNNAEGVTLNNIWQAIKKINSSLSRIENRLTRLEKKVGLEDSPVLVL